MGNKRTRPKAPKNVYEEDDEKHNQAPDNLNVQSDLPKGFQRLLKRVNDKNNNAKKKKEQKQKKETNSIEDKIKERLVLQPNESLAHFNRRVEQTLGNNVSLFKMAKVGKSQKKEKRKQRVELARQKLLELEEEDNKRLDFDKMKDNIKFGEVAMAPPTINAKPKDRAKNRRELLKSTQLLERNQKGQVKKNHNYKPINIEPVGPKKSIPSLAQKRILESERTRVVELYRKLKKEKLEANQN